MFKTLEIILMLGIILPSISYSMEHDFGSQKEGLTGIVSKAVVLYEPKEKFQTKKVLNQESEDYNLTKDCINIQKTLSCNNHLTIDNLRKIQVYLKILQGESPSSSKEKYSEHSFSVTPQFHLNQFNHYIKFSDLYQFITKIQQQLDNEVNRQLNTQFSIQKSINLLQCDYKKEIKNFHQINLDNIELKAGNKRLSYQVQKLEDALVEEQYKKEGLEKHLSLSRANINHLSEQIAKSGDIVKNKELEHKKYISELYEDIKTKNLKLNEFEQHIAQQKEKLDSSEYQIQNLARLLEIEKSERQLLLKINEDLRSQFFYLEQNTKDLEKTNQILRSKVLGNNLELEKQEKIIEKGQKYLEKIEQEKKEVEQKYTESGYQLGSLEDQLKIYQGIIISKDENLKQKGSEIISLNQSIKEKQERILTFEKERNVDNDLSIIKTNLKGILSMLGETSQTDNIVEMSSNLMMIIIPLLNKR